MAAEILPKSDFLTNEQVVASGVSFSDYLKQFDGQHAEWLCGDVIIMSNNTQHAAIFTFLITLFNFYLGLMKVGEVLPAGVSMYVGDQLPAREPDLIILLNEHLDRVKDTYLDGVADIAIEIVSPESEVRDYVTKYREYEMVGVREYWIIDPQREQADIYLLNDEGQYRRSALNAQGRLTSNLLPKFALDPALFWGKKLPNGMELVELVQAMTA